MADNPVETMKGWDIRQIGTCAGIQLLVWGAVVGAFWDTIYLDGARYAEAEYTYRLRAGAESTYGTNINRRSAEAYWACYPDVARDGYFGEEGPLGILGAREHFDRHGFREGRIWPLLENGCMSSEHRF